MNVHRIAYVRVTLLAFAAFIFNTTEFIPVALLSDIAADFSMDATSVGLIITVYAWAVSILSLPLMLLTSKLERKRLLLQLFVLFALSHVLAAIAWNFTVLVIARLGIAISHAIFWSITSSLVVRLAPINKGSQAIGMLALGTSLAMVLGLPLGARGRRAFGLEDYVFRDRRACGGGGAVSLENFTIFAKPSRGLSCELADACKAPYAACFVSADPFDRRRAFYDLQLRRAIRGEI